MDNQNGSSDEVHNLEYPDSGYYQQPPADTPYDMSQLPLHLNSQAWQQGIPANAPVDDELAAMNMDTAQSGSAVQHQKAKKKKKDTPAFYCELCRVNCLGSQVYKDHLEGQRHRKRQAAALASSSSESLSPSPSRGHLQLYQCQLCGINCTDLSGYNSHINGTKHQKTIRLHQQLGKEIPSSVPVVVEGIKTEDTRADPTQDGATSTAAILIKKKRRSRRNKSAMMMTEDEMNQYPGMEYINEVLTGDGDIRGFKCMLCECDLTTAAAKLDHVKGRQHRAAYKIIMGRTRVLSPETAAKCRRAMDRTRQKMQSLLQREVALKFLYEQKRVQRLEAQQEYYEQHLLYSSSGCTQPNMSKQNDLFMDIKHDSIYPEREFERLQDIVVCCEKSLKLVSDTFCKQNDQPEMESGPLKGVTRIGNLVKGLLLEGDTTVELALICNVKPTHSLLTMIHDRLQDYLLNSEEVQYKTTVNEGGIDVTSIEEPVITCRIRLTSQLYSDENVETESPDAADELDKDICLPVLTEIKHAKWFQARAVTVPSCVHLLRILRDMHIHDEIWQPFNMWAIEVLTERVLSNSTTLLSPSNALSSLFEFIATGGLFDTVLLDPCEKNEVDLLTHLTTQHRENLTEYAQKAIRMIAFQQIGQLLDVEITATGSVKRRCESEQPEKNNDDEDEGESAGSTKNPKL